MKKAIVTMVIGKETHALARYTVPYLNDYADKCDATLFEINDLTFQSTGFKIPHYTKLYLSELLNGYDRIIYIDADILVKPDAPNLFDIVPQNKLGIFEEGKHWGEGYRNNFNYFVGAYSVASQKMDFDPRTWNQRYYNTGVMVLSKQHARIFTRPAVEIYSMGEQNYLNMRIAQENPVVQELDVEFNFMPYLGEKSIDNRDRTESHFIHYAGTPHNERIGMIEEDYKKLGLELPAMCPSEVLAKWVYSLMPSKKRTYIVAMQCSGAGDKINFTPTLRHYKLAHPDEEIALVTDEFMPRVFANNPYIDYLIPAHSSTPNIGGDDKVIDMRWSFNEQHQHEHVTRSYMHHVLGHYEEDCTMEMFVNSKDCARIDGVIRSLPDEGKPYAVIAPTFTMKNRALSEEFWQKFSDRLREKYTVLNIGNSRDYDVAGAFDLRDKLEINQIPDFLNQVAYKVFCVNTGMLHIAGCSRADIVFFSVGEFPSSMLVPYRSGKFGSNCEVVEHKCPIKEKCFNGHISESILRPQLEMEIKKHGDKYDQQILRKWAAWNYCAKDEDKWSCSREMEERILSNVEKWFPEEKVIE